MENRLNMEHKSLKKKPKIKVYQIYLAGEITSATKIYNNELSL